MFGCWLPSRAGIFPSRQVVHALVGQPGGMRVQHADVDLLPLPCRIAMAQRGKDADAAIQAGEQVGDRHAYLLRHPVRLPGQAHHPAHRLDQAIVAGSWRVRSGLPEAGNRAVDQAWKHCVQIIVTQSVFRQRADLEVLHQYVALRNQLARDRLAFRSRDVERDRALVAIDADEIGALLSARHGGRSETAGVVAAARLLDLDHIGAQITEHLRAGRPGQDARQVEHLQPPQRPTGFAHPPLRSAHRSRRASSLARRL